MKKIGLRNIKTALAVVISVVILRIFSSETYFFAPIAAIMTMQNTVYSSFRTGLNRMIGTTIGAVIAIIAVELSVNVMVNSILIFVGIILVIYLCNVLNFKQSVGIACIVFLMIILYADNIAPVEYGISRLLETFMGIIIALGVNFVVSPNESQKKMYEHYDKLKEQIDEIFKNIILNGDNPKLFTLRDDISEFKAIFSSYQFEHMDDNEYEEELDLINNRIKLLREANVHLKLLYDMRANCCLSTANYAKLKESDYEINLRKSAVLPIDDHENIVFNFHVDKMINLIKKL
ncbi:FUSC family protein [Oceanirhabdus sp. W0125-5]|uniref:FUSC family protein n=1 Tax=Oceanirhabdus sp. W0125-5 TaxID=2999116 RepID=UPI0022F2ABA1|nr:aromatic acid exporter family protein [Oceanirhabdus sp. W0125-5]WBW98315.1 aromatic acid exporter family protein [Oceanirhabdus sp. W0125-5]